MAIAEAKRVCLQTQNGLEGAASIQKDHLLRALGNVVQNAIEHTPRVFGR
jgi:signal transduction histidine kinase